MDRLAADLETNHVFLVCRCRKTMKSYRYCAFFSLVYSWYSVQDAKARQYRNGKLPKLHDAALASYVSALKGPLCQNLLVARLTLQSPDQTGNLTLTALHMHTLTPCWSHGPHSFFGNSGPRLGPFAALRS